LSNLFAGALKAVLSFIIGPGLRLGFSYLSRDPVHSLFQYGSWFFVLSLVRQLTPQIGPLIIGSGLGLWFVTPYNIASRLVSYVTSILIAGTGVLTPVTTAYHANDKHREQKTLFVTGSKYCLTLSLFFLALLIIVGKAFIALWMGK